MSYIEVSTLMEQKFQTPSWVVEGLLRTGRRRPSLLLGKPEAGKSTIARQLAAAVVKGEPFLGRPTKRSSVLYWQTEEDPVDLQQMFRGFGIRKDVDAQLHIFTGNSDESGPADVAAQLALHPDVGLVIIETLDDLLKIENVKENSASRESFDAFHTTVMAPYSSRMAVLGLWHLKKTETAFAGDALLGASTVRGRTDGKIFLAQADPGDERRLIWSDKRIGVAIPKTYLAYDAATSMVELGQSFSEVRKFEKEAIEDDVTRAVLVHVGINNADGVNMREAIALFKGKGEKKTAKIHQMIAEGLLVNKGTASQFRLHLPEPRAEVINPLVPFVMQSADAGVSA